MDIRKYSITEFDEMQEDLIGSLVSLYSLEDKVGVCMSGKGILTNLRREQGDIYARVFWTKTPFFNHIEKRKFGWHSVGRLFILQNKFGEKNYAHQNNHNKRK